jgi:two-component system probable response regulator PhcQ
MMRRILLLDDEINVLHSLQRALRQCLPDVDMQTEIFTDPEQALVRGGEVPFDLVVSDYRMPGMNGADFLQAMKGIQPDAVRLVLSASTEFDAVMSAINRAEIFRYIAKPWQNDDLKNAFELAFARRDQALEDRRLVDEARARRGELTPQEIEAKRLEAEEPGIMKVKWGADGSVHLE